MQGIHNSCDLIFQLHLYLPVQSMPEILFPLQIKVYAIQLHVTKLLNTFSRQFSLGTPIFSTNRIEHHNITVILLEVTLKINNPKKNKRNKNTKCSSGTMQVSS